MFGFGGTPQQAPPPSPSDTRFDNTAGPYKVPDARANGRPHELGWLDMLKDEKSDQELRLGKIAPGRIIAEE